MSKITYNHSVKVYLDGEHIGTIREGKAGFTYTPKNSNAVGEPFLTLAACKASLEAQ